MSTYTVANMSGSVGKTTTVVTAAVQLAASGLRVRVIDLDPQANATTWLGYPDIGGTTIADVLRLDATINDIERPARIIDYTEDGDLLFSDDPDALIDNLTIVPAALIHFGQAHGRAARRRRGSHAPTRRPRSRHFGRCHPDRLTRIQQRTGDRSADRVLRRRGRP